MAPCAKVRITHFRRWISKGGFRHPPVLVMITPWTKTNYACPDNPSVEDIRPFLVDFAGEFCREPRK